MGSDIHIVVEEKVGGAWLPIRMIYSFNNEYARPDVPGGKIQRFASSVARSRNYERFSKLAGVRGDGPPAKGFPADVSAATKHFLETYGGDHSASWTPMLEAIKIFVETGEALDEFEAKYPAYYYFALEDTVGDNSDKFLERFRIVYNFDS